jgi:hypothetical protein
VDAQLTVDIEDYPDITPSLFNNTQGVWQLFKALRKLPLYPEQIVMLIRKHGLGQGRALIMREMGMSSREEYDRNMHRATQTVQWWATGKVAKGTQR